MVTATGDEGAQAREASESTENGDLDPDLDLELRRQEHFPTYVPRKGTGGNVVDGAGDEGTVVSRNASPMPMASGPIRPTVAATGPSYFPPYNSQSSTLLPPLANTGVPASPSTGLATPGTSSAYSPAGFGDGSTDTGNMSSPGTLGFSIFTFLSFPLALHSCHLMTLRDSLHNTRILTDSLSRFCLVCANSDRLAPFASLKRAERRCLAKY